MHRVPFCLLLAVACALVGRNAQAQLVAVGPGYVKAPFVRVYHYPDGSSYVRAPFVSVYTPGYGWGPAPSERFDRLDWRSLGAAVHDWAARLDEDLHRLPTTERWRSKLQPAEIAASVDGERNEPPAMDLRGHLAEVLSQYDRAAESSQFGNITRLESFQALRAALAEYVLPPDVRLRRQLIAADEDLRRSLARFNTAESWQRYLALSPTVSDEADEAPEPPTLDIEELTAARKRFDSVTSNDEFWMIARLPAFQTTRARLEAYLRLLEEPSHPVEELPTPPPDES